MKNSIAPKISVIIPAKNEENNIDFCLKGIQKQVLKPAECIVVDNGSEDRTAEIARVYGAKVIILPNANIGELRNVGAANAKGDVLAFLDADCVPEKDWLLRACELLKDEKIGAVGNTVLLSDSGNWIEKVWYYNVKQNSGDVRYIGSANLLVKRNVFERIGGFSPELKAGEDRELSWKIQRAGLRTIHDERIHVIHRGYPRSIYEFFKRELWHGKAIISDFANLSRSRIIYILIFNSLLFITLAVSFLIGKYIIFIMIIISLLLIPTLISFIKCNRNRNIRYLLPLSLLYFIYLSARTISLYFSIYEHILAPKIKGNN